MEQMFLIFQAMITEVTEDEWDTPKDPSSKLTKENTLRIYAKRGISKKFAQSTIYKLSPDMFVDSLNSKSKSAVELLVQGYRAYDSTATSANITRKLANCLVDIIRTAAALTTQNNAFLTLKGLQEAKVNADEALRRSIEDILREIQFILNTKMEEFNDSLFTVKKESPYVQFNTYNSYMFETPDNTGTGSNYKEMLVYDLAILFMTALPALAHDSLLFTNLSKDAVDGIVKIYMSTSKQIFIAYDKQSKAIPDLKRNRYWKIIVY